MKNNLCAKQTTIAVIVKENRFYVGTNWCETPQKECPRKDLPSGEGYEMCRDICHQNAHAEVDALLKAGTDARGGTLYLIGHTYCCDNCLKAMQEYGIEKVNFCERNYINQYLLSEVAGVHTD